MFNENMRFSIRWKFLIPFVLIIVLVVFVIVPVVSNRVTTQIEAAADDRLSETVTSVTAMLVRTAEQAELSASFVANLQEVQGALSQEEVLGRILPARQESLGLQEISYYGADYQSGDTPIYYGGPISNRRFQVSESAQEARAQLLVNVLLSGEPGRTIAIAPQGSQILGAAPVYWSIDGSTETLQGIILTAFFLDDSYINDISNVLGADVAIIKDNATIVSTIDPSTGFEQILQDGLIDPLGENNTINLEADMGDEISSQRLLAQPLILNGLPSGTVLVSQSINEFTQVERLIRTGAIMMSGLVIIMSTVFGIFSYLNFAQPITELAAAARKVEEGDFSVRVIGHSMIRDEISELSEDFNSMTDRLETLVTGLEEQVEERTRELVDERNKLEIMGQELESARDEALEANRTKSAFLANMSHELRTPLNSILGYTELLVQGLYGDMTDKQVDRMQKVMSNGKHLLELINDILDLSKIEAGRMELRLEPVALPKLVEQCVNSVEPLAKNKGLDLIVNVPDNARPVLADKSRMMQVLMNLTSNAIKFTPEGAVTIFSQEVKDRADIPDHKKINLDGQQGPWMLLGVDDTGIGIAEEDHSKVFDEFQQVDDTSTREFEGTGLGMAITRRLVHLMKGEIWLESAPGEGSTFYVLLPLSKEKMAEPQAE